MAAFYSSSVAATANAANALVMPPSWMPIDWDRNIYPGAQSNIGAANQHNFRQDMLQTTPLTLWAVANYNANPAESYGLVMIWAAAIRSCERGSQIMEDLGGEFGDRDRGKAALLQSQKDFKTWSASQPKNITLYFTAKLGQWNQSSGSFQLQEAGVATTLRPHLIERDGYISHGANVGFWTGPEGQAINHFQASISAPACVSKDGKTLHEFPRMSQWWVVFGDAYTGFGGIRSYRSRAFLPPIAVSREAAAALARRNPQRKVEVAVTFVPAGSSFNDGRNQYTTMARYRKVEVSDAVDGSVLVSKTY